MPKVKLKPGWLLKDARKAYARLEEWRNNTETSMPDLNIPGFLNEMLDIAFSSDLMDSIDIADAMTRNGIITPHAVTAEEIAANPSFREWDLEPGDTWLFPSPAFKSWLASNAPKPHI